MSIRRLLRLVGVPALFIVHGDEAASAQRPPVPCSRSGRVLFSAGGAVVGAFVGLVAWHVRYSDWADVVHTPAGRRARNQAMVGGAVGGAILANLPLLRPSCGRGGLATTEARREAHQTITTADIQRFGATGSVYDLVYRLHRDWLNLRGLSLAETPSVEQDMKRGGRVTEASEASLVVYLDNARAGDWTQLREMPLVGITEVRYYNASQATLRFGPGHEHGVIQVLTGTPSNPK